MYGMRYGGETLTLRRRQHEHFARMLDVQGVTQQSFYEVIRRGRVSPRMVAYFACSWLFMPVAQATFCNTQRKEAEAAMIKTCHLELNPPLLTKFLPSSVTRSSFHRLLVARYKVCLSRPPRQM